MKALVITDVQNDFCPGGALAVPEGDRIIPIINRLQPHFDLVVATQDWHPPDHGSFAANHEGREPGEVIELGGLEQILWPVHCVQHTPGAAFHNGLDQARITAVFQKGTHPGIDSYSGFFDNAHRKATGLGEWLKERRVTEVYLCGLATDYCVKFTALDAVALGFATYVIEDACRGVNLRPGDVVRAVDEMRSKGVRVIPSAEVGGDRMTSHSPNSVLPHDHTDRMARARLSLTGLSIGDAFGECFFSAQAPWLIANRALPREPWHYTDDTAMALSIVETLDERGRIDCDDLAQRFAERYRDDPGRGYGGMAHRILTEIGNGVAWQEAAGKAFGGEGSMGNGGAMRVGPVGAYFADDLEAAVENARDSARVTHAHPDGQAGAIAIAVAAAQAWRMRDGSAGDSASTILQAAIEHTPEGKTREGLVIASRLSPDETVDSAVEVLGNGSLVVSWDTVPFAVWCAARHLDRFEEALWATVSGLGDCDTTCAMVGSIVALSVGREGIPEAWVRAREPLGR